MNEETTINIQIIANMLKVKGEEKILKAAREKSHHL